MSKDRRRVKKNITYAGHLLKIASSPFANGVESGHYDRQVTRIFKNEEVR